jgi:hypothetical protein
MARVRTYRLHEPAKEAPAALTKGRPPATPGVASTKESRQLWLLRLTRGKLSEKKAALQPLQCLTRLPRE